MKSITSAVHRVRSGMRVVISGGNLAACARHIADNLDEENCFRGEFEKEDGTGQVVVFDIDCKVYGGQWLFRFCEAMVYDINGEACDNDFTEEDLMYYL